MTNWEIVKGYERYAVSNKGVVKVIRTDKVLKQAKNKKGYMQVWLSNGENRKKFLVHRLVATSFVSNPNNKPQINHKDGNKANNSADNLEWVTSQENITHSIQVLGNKPKGRKTGSHNSYIKKPYIKKGGVKVGRRNLYLFRHEHKLRQSEMAEKCGVSRVTYGKIENGNRGGSADFWYTLQKVFGVPDEKMWKLQKVEERKDQCETEEK